MTTQATLLTGTHGLQPIGAQPRSLWQRAWSINPMLTILLAATVGQFIISLVGLFVDPRIVVGMPNWAKNLKFAISFLLYIPTLLWIFSLIERHRKTAWWMATGIGVSLLVEVVLLVTQAVRGQPVHYNVATPFDALLWSLMGNTITVFFLFFLVAIVVYWRQLNQDRVIGWAIRLGLLIMVIGFAQGGLMTQPTSAQLAQIQAGQFVAAVGAHTVGAVDGGPGLPILGWSTQHGDLRIGHFVGIHGLQVIPLLGWWLTRRRSPKLREGQQIALVWIGALGYLGLTVLVTWQALRGQSILAPDGLTLAALAGLIMTVAGAALIILQRGKILRQARQQ